MLRSVRGFRLRGRGFLGWAALSELEQVRVFPVPGSRETVWPVPVSQRRPLGVWPGYLALLEMVPVRAPQGPGLPGSDRRVWVLLELGFPAWGLLAWAQLEQDQPGLALPVSDRRAWDLSVAQARPEQSALA